MLYLADQSSQARIKVSSTGPKSPTNQPNRTYFNSFVPIALQAGQAATLSRLSLFVSLGVTPWLARLPAKRLVPGSNQR
jgi:hypothetical protein